MSLICPLNGSLGNCGAAEIKAGQNRYRVFLGSGEGAPFCMEPLAYPSCPPSWTDYHDVVRALAAHLKEVRATLLDQRHQPDATGPASMGPKSWSNTFVPILRTPNWWLLLSMPLVCA